MENKIGRIRMKILEKEFDVKIVIIIQLSIILSGMSPKCWLWLYNKSLIDQLVWSTRKNIWTLAFRTDLISFSPYLKTAVQIFSRTDLTIGQ